MPEPWTEYDTRLGSSPGPEYLDEYARGLIDRGIDPWSKGLASTYRWYERGKLMISMLQFVVENPRAIRSLGKADFWLRRGELLLQIARYVAGHPADLFLEYHTKHISLLLSVLASVWQGKEIQKEIRAIGRNVERYDRECGRLARQVRRIPTDPLDGIADWDLRLMSLARIPILARIYELYLRDYEKLVEDAALAVKGALNAGEQILSQSERRISQLELQIEGIGDQSVPDKRVRNFDYVTRKGLLAELQHELKVVMELPTHSSRNELESALKQLEQAWQNIRVIRY